MDELTTQQKEILEHYQEIAGGLDNAESIAILVQHDWNLSAAVSTLMFDGGDSNSAPSSQQQTNQNHSNSDSILQQFLSQRQTSHNAANSNITNHQHDDDDDVTRSRPSLQQQFSVSSTGSLRRRESSDQNVQRRNQRSTNSANQDNRSNFSVVFSWMSWSSALATRFMPRILIKLITFLFLPFQVTFDLMREFYSLLVPDVRRNVTNALGDVSQFIQSYQSKYCVANVTETASQPAGEEAADMEETPPTTQQHAADPPPFLRMTYKDAVRKAKSDLKFILVYLHCDDHPANDSIARDLLNSSRFQSLLRENDALIWGCSVKSPEGYQVWRNFRLRHERPFMGVIVLNSTFGAAAAMIGGMAGVAEALSAHSSLSSTSSSATSSSDLKMMLVDYFYLDEELARPSEDSSSASASAAYTQFQERVARDFRKFRLILDQQRSGRASRALTQQIRQDQDAAYQQSLRMDRERIEEKRRKEREEREQLEKEQLEQELADTQRIEWERRRRVCRQRMEKCLQAEMNDQEKPNVHIRLKLPDGRNVMGRFRDTDSVKLLFYLVLANSEQICNFQISSNLPGSSKIVIDCVPEHPEWQEEDDANSEAEQTNQINRNVRPGDPKSFAEWNLIGQHSLMVLDMDA